MSATPGTWLPYYDKESQTYEVKAMGNTRVALIAKHDMQHEDMDNARILSASKELLEAAEKLIEISKDLFGDDRERHPRIMDKFEQAVGKAYTQTCN